MLALVLTLTAAELAKQAITTTILFIFHSIDNTLYVVVNPYDT